LVLFLKIILEAIFLFSVSTFLKQRWNWAAFLSLQLIYPFYVIIVGASSAFVRISWKGRKIQ
jgi:poly-beta-1,6-N-acetyl-D-glucosamine synthase